MRAVVQPAEHLGPHRAPNHRRPRPPRRGDHRRHRHRAPGTTTRRRRAHDKGMASAPPMPSSGGAPKRPTSAATPHRHPRPHRGSPRTSSIDACPTYGIGGTAGSFAQFVAGRVAGAGGTHFSGEVVTRAGARGVQGPEVGRLAANGRLRVRVTVLGTQGTGRRSTQDLVRTRRRRRSLLFPAVPSERSACWPACWPVESAAAVSSSQGGSSLAHPPWGNRSSTCSSVVLPVFTFAEAFGVGVRLVCARGRWCRRGRRGRRGR